MNDNSKAITERVARLERACVLQGKLIAKLGAAAQFQQATIEALAREAGIDCEPQQPAPRAPLSKMN